MKHPAPDRRGPGRWQPATTPAPVQMRFPDANRETGEGFPALPCKPARNASIQEMQDHDREYRRIVEDRKALCSEEWRRHVAAMEQAGAQSTEPINHPGLAQLAVANLRQLDDLEAAASSGTGPMLPQATGVYFFVRKLPDGVRGMRVPERLNGEIWVVGWCGHPCGAGANCLSSVGRTPPSAPGGRGLGRGLRLGGGLRLGPGGGTGRGDG